MFLKNIDQVNELCNGTRLQVIHLRKNVIGVKVIAGKNIDDNIFIPIMNLTFYESGMSFKFQKKQFTIYLCFAMTINKSQDQTLIFNLSHNIFIFVYLVYS